jgi:predicted transcriptional regulator
MTGNHEPDTAELDDPFPSGDGDDGIDLSSREYGVYECTDPDCENVVLSLRDSGDHMSCHGESMAKIRDWEMDVKPPELRQVLLDVFGLPRVGLDICLCVIGEGPVSPATVAEELGYDQSTITRYLNQLVEIGLLEKSQLNRESGGFVNVYHSIDLEDMRRESLIGFYVWAGEAASLIEEANLTKAEYSDGAGDQQLHDVFWEAFEERTK